MENKAVAERTVDRSQENRRFVSPAVDILEQKDAYMLEAEMPGVNSQSLEIMLEGNELTIIGRKTKDSVGGQLVYKESRDYDYRRVFELDPSIDTGKISARMDQGILCLTLPKSENTKPRRIQISD